MSHQGNNQSFCFHFHNYILGKTLTIFIILSLVFKIFLNDLQMYLLNYMIKNTLNIKLYDYFIVITNYYIYWFLKNLKEYIKDNKVRDIMVIIQSILFIYLF